MVVSFSVLVVYFLYICVFILHPSNYHYIDKKTCGIMCISKVSLTLIYSMLTDTPIIKKDNIIF